MVCVLLGTTQANAMLRKYLMAGGIGGVAGALSKKYFYDPLTIKRKYKKYLAPQNVQKLSNQLLDAHLKTGQGGLKVTLKKWFAALRNLEQHDRFSCHPKWDGLILVSQGLNR